MPASQTPAESAADSPGSCGWYDSSFELRSGLTVSTEDLDPLLFEPWLSEAAAGLAAEQATTAVH